MRTQSIMTAKEEHDLKTVFAKIVSSRLDEPITGVNNANSSTISVGMMSTDFKSTMKHNSSNNSIHSHGPKKQMVTTIRKPTDL